MVMLPFYGLSIVCGILFSIATMQFLMKSFLRKEVNYNTLFLFIFYVYLFSFFGGKLFYLVFDYDWTNGVCIEIFKYGFSIFGSAFFGIIFFCLIRNKKIRIVFFKKNHADYEIIQIIIPIVVPIVSLFGRIGCYMAKCCGGNILIFNKFVPIQFVSAFFYFICFLFQLSLLFFFKDYFFKKIDKFFSAIFFLSFYVLTIITERIVLDNYRNDVVANFLFGFSKYQTIAIVFFVAFMILLLFLYLTKFKK